MVWRFDSFPRALEFVTKLREKLGEGLAASVDADTCEVQAWVGTVQRVELAQRVGLEYGITGWLEQGEGDLPFLPWPLT